MPLPQEPVSRRDRPAKPPLTRRSILDAALALVAQHGVDAVAMRQVAQAVNTGPASLYAYFGSRDVLLEHALDVVYQQVGLVDATDGDWRAALAATIVNTITTLERFPGIGAVALGTIPTLPGALRLAEHELALMELGGVNSDRAALGVDLIAQLAAVTAIERAVRPPGTGGDAGRARVEASYGSADAERFPRVSALAAALTGPDERARRDFAIGVVVAGIEGGAGG